MIDVEICMLYNAGLTTSEVGTKVGVSSSTVRRALKRNGVELRKNWRPSNGVKDGQKQCRMCNKWKPRENFYTRKDGSPYSYCKPCDRDRSVKAGRKSRQIKRHQEQVIRSERKNHNAKSRMLLADVADFLKRRYPDIDLLDRIKAHLSVSQRLFGDRKV